MVGGGGRRWRKFISTKKMIGKISIFFSLYEYNFANRYFI